MSIVPFVDKRWPSSRGERATFVRRFGAAPTDRLQRAINRGDPVADALVAIGGNRGMLVRRQVAHGLRFGLASLDAPDEAVVRLLEETESVPAHVDEALIASGPPGWYAVPRSMHLASMSAGALLGLYAAPSIAGVLSSTDRLLSNAGHRLRDTAHWLSMSMLPGSLAVGQAGYVATVEVRLLHAHMRRKTRRRGHDERAFGVPINQADLALTWLGFTLTSMRAEASIGFDLSEAEIAGNYGYWQQQAHLLGIDAELVGDVRDHDDASRLEELLRTTASGTPEASVALTEHTLRVAAEELEGMLPVPGGTGEGVLRALATRFDGDGLGRALGEGSRPAFTPLLTPFAAAARVQRSAARRDTTQWNTTCANRVIEARELLADAANDEPNAYQRLSLALDASVRTGTCPFSDSAAVSCPHASMVAESVTEAA